MALHADPAPLAEYGSVNELINRLSNVAGLKLQPSTFAGNAQSLNKPTAILNTTSSGKTTVTDSNKSGKSIATTISLLSTLEDRKTPLDKARERPEEGHREVTSILQSPGEWMASVGRVDTDG
ncbi:unnamed protein product [Diamesa serratosioi]